MREQTLCRRAGQAPPLRWGRTFCLYIHISIAVTFRVDQGIDPYVAQIFPPVVGADALIGPQSCDPVRMCHAAQAASGREKTNLRPACWDGGCFFICSGKCAARSLSRRGGTAGFLGKPSADIDLRPSRRPKYRSLTCYYGVTPPAPAPRAAVIFPSSAYVKVKVLSPAAPPLSAVTTAVQSQPLGRRSVVKPLHPD